MNRFVEKILDTKRVDDLTDRFVFSSGRRSPWLHRAHYMQIHYATNEWGGKNPVLFLVKAPEQLNRVYSTTYDQRKSFEQKCFPEATIRGIEPLTSLKSGRETNQLIHETLDNGAVIIGGEIQHQLAAFLGGYYLFSGYKRGSLDYAITDYLAVEGNEVLFINNRDLAYSCSREEFDNTEVSGTNLKRLIWKDIYHLKKDRDLKDLPQKWKILTPPQIHKDAEALIKDKDFQKALVRDPPAPHGIKKYMADLKWVHR
jgi:hypothetical protein